MGAAVGGGLGGCRGHQYVHLWWAPTPPPPLHPLVLQPQRAIQSRRLRRAHGCLSALMTRARESRRLHPFFTGEHRGQQYEPAPGGGRGPESASALPFPALPPCRCVPTPPTPPPPRQHREQRLVAAPRKRFRRPRIKRYRRPPPPPKASDRRADALAAWPPLPARQAPPRPHGPDPAD